MDVEEAARCLRKIASRRDELPSGRERAEVKLVHSFVGTDL